jgi:outer membrane cobalamin receptor
MQGFLAFPVLALCACAPLCAFADDAATTPTITVIGERSELQDSGVVIHVPVAPLGAASLADLLATLPGVQVRTSGGLGSYSEASLRGSSGRQVRILLDGLPLDTGGGDATSLSLVSPLLLDSVDVYEGRVPVTLGSGLAGTINLRTRRTLAAPLVYAGSLGSFGARQLDVASQLGDSVQLAFGGQAADNDFSFVNAFKPFDPDDPDRRDRERRNNAATKQYYGLLRYRGPLELTAHVVDDLQQLPDRANGRAADAELDTHSYALSATTPEDALWQLALSHRETREDYRDPASRIGLGAQDTQSDTRRTLLSVGRRYAFVQDTLTSEYTDYAADDRIGEVPTASAHRFSIRNGIAAQIGDVRRYNASLIAGWSRDGSDGDRDEHWQFEPAIGASQRFDACLAAFNLGHRQRLPTFFERYGDRGLFKGNPELDPETANYADLGARCQPGERVQRFALTVFGQDLHDAISPSYNAQGVGRSVNTARALIYGAEFDSAGTFAGFGWQLGGTWQHSEDRSDVRATRGQQLPGRFETQLNARIEHAWHGVVVYYAFRYEAGGYYDSPNLLRTPEMQRHDLGVRGAFGALGWSVQALNLGDDRIEQFNGYPTPGRQWLLSLNYPNRGAGIDAGTDPQTDPPTEGESR